MSSTTDTLPTDVDDLREFALARIAEIAERDAKLSERDERIKLLEEALRLARSEKFAPSSETDGSIQGYLFNEAELELDADEAAIQEDVGTQVAAHTRKKRGRRPLPESLERIEHVIDLPEDQKVCEKHATPLREIGRDTAERLEIIPARIYVSVEVRPKYVCPCCEDGPVHSAPATRHLVPKGIGSASLIAWVASSKYCDALPLYRQEKILERIGVDVSRATLANWMVAFGTQVEPLMGLLRADLVAYDLMEMDETRFQVLKEDGKRATSQSYLWAQRGGPQDHPIVVFTYDPTRAGEVAKRLLGDFKGIVQTDGYAGYDDVGKQEGIVHAGCFAHVRRKFVDALKGGSSLKKGSKSRKKSKAQQGLDFIQKLYKIEKALSGKSPEERQRLRCEQAKPVLDAFKVWLDATETAVPPKSLTGKAVAYTRARWTRLVRYLDDGRLRIDTNLVENAIRPFVVGRKNWLFADTPRGARASANLYSLVETARNNELEPCAYLRHLATKLPLAQSEADLRALLPNRLPRSDLAGARHPTRHD